MTEAPVPAVRFVEPDFDAPAAENWVCGRCERGQCAKCADPKCTCCNGNPDE